ncbi:PE family protein [Mycobacterium kansasii]|uniref:PE family protein n=4 Tax=Mycobacterium kansasii TaxID=1768 RepID=A0A653EIV2_MYCKA|nr:PE family protein [Mycobacterium kansasii ATCC 12478]ARG54978.1 PE family protein [Mycobacterium kansasii]EUA22133.1 PE family protein [Mycobacterium kansasii 662]ARG60429.1 PE family protein [Mycobacterium kansasii]ARG68111.1 PE family protein [Mycobacterium kansasii]
MSFVTTRPAALTAAASALHIVGSSMATQNAAAAAPTTGLVPTAADQASALQAAQFAAYGTWYQQVSAQAMVIHQMLVNTLGSSAGSYAKTEAANRTAAGSTSLSGLLGGLATGGAGLSSSSGATIGTPIGWAQLQRRRLGPGPGRARATRRWLRQRRRFEFNGRHGRRDA